MSRSNGAILSALQSGRALHTSGAGYFLIPAGPGQGVQPANSGVSWTYGAWSTMTTGIASAFLVTGMTFLYSGGAVTQSEIQIQLGTGGTSGADAASPAGDSKGWITNAGSTVGMNAFLYPILVPANTRLAVRIASTTGTVSIILTLQCLAQANLVAG